MKFLVDNQLPPALVRFISGELRTETLHVVDVGLRERSDLDVWNYASANGFVLISKDDDFATSILQDSFRRTAVGAAGKLPSSLPAESLPGAMAENSRAIREWRALRRASLTL